MLEKQLPGKKMGKTKKDLIGHDEGGRTGGRSEGR